MKHETFCIILAQVQAIQKLFRFAQQDKVVLSLLHLFYWFVRTRTIAIGHSERSEESFEL